VTGDPVIQEDEFQFLEDDASRLGLDASRGEVTRLSTVVTSGAKVEALVWGSQPSIAFLHGAGLNAHTWDTTALWLRETAACIELPGHGGSSWRDDIDYRPAVIAPDCAEAIEAFCQLPVTLVGHSLGGQTAVSIVADRPDLVRRLILVDSTPGRQLAAGGVRVREFMACQESYESLDELVTRAIDYGIGTNPDDLRRGLILNTRKRGDGRYVFKHHFGSLAPDAVLPDFDATELWPVLENSGIPVLLVYGSHGFLSGENVDEFLSRVPRSSALELDAGHNLQRDQPIGLANAIKAFTDAEE
jgi:pimeloyl-ACP methyl ester carboxylesterase